MLNQRSHDNPEYHRQRYVEDIFETLPPVEMGVDIPRVYLSRLATGKDSKLKLSVKEALGRDGWDFDHITKAGKGGVVIHETGDEFEVLEVKKGRMKIRNTETGDLGEIVAQERTIPAQEYIYKISDKEKNSKKITVYDTVYKDRSIETSEFIDSMVASIPTQCMDVFDEIQIHRRSGGQTGESKIEPSMFSNRRVISLYVGEDGYPTEVAKQTFYHELGHAIVKYLKNGSAHPGKKWRDAMVADGNVVSEYAEKKRYSKENHRGNDEDLGEVEEFAEIAKFYFALDGAKTDKTQPIRDCAKNRFRKFDEVLEDLERKKRLGVVGKLKSHLYEQTGALKNN